MSENFRPCPSACGRPAVEDHVPDSAPRKALADCSPEGPSDGVGETLDLPQHSSARRWPDAVLEIQRGLVREGFEARETVKFLRYIARV